jgi:hypothetical protein
VSIDFAARFQRLFKKAVARSLWILNIVFLVAQIDSLCFCDVAFPAPDHLKSLHFLQTLLTRCDAHMCRCQPRVPSQFANTRQTCWFRAWTTSSSRRCSVFDSTLGFPGEGPGDEHKNAGAGSASLPASNATGKNQLREHLKFAVPSSQRVDELIARASALRYTIDGSLIVLVGPAAYTIDKVRDISDDSGDDSDVDHDTNPWAGQAAAKRIAFNCEFSDIAALADLLLAKPKARIAILLQNTLNLEHFSLLVVDQTHFSGALFDGWRQDDVERQAVEVVVALSLALHCVNNQRWLYAANPSVTPVEQVAQLPLDQRYLSLFHAFNTVRCVAKQLFTQGHFSLDVIKHVHAAHVPMCARQMLDCASSVSASHTAAAQSASTMPPVAQSPLPQKAREPGAQYARVKQSPQPPAAQVQAIPAPPRVQSAAALPIAPPARVQAASALAPLILPPSPRMQPVVAAVVLPQARVQPAQAQPPPQVQPVAVQLRVPPAPPSSPARGMFRACLHEH